ncbi:hypothetical protein EDD29_7811 [Actinocorallia herbida]|uniref:Bacterial transcriptional activator domain-containing protein n=1 Tax=Actinocorallia herbida TaxID=58109 RepID=A0A3N1D992_9ACTN|nr:bacterial transcriptional activator domain-containing protein [Actinocorallia herbida]ROO90095.1 hypothetical protein EDD29_7811 [Actinocorallia herbida]
MLVGLLSLVVLGALVGGVPYALVRFVGSPLPEGPLDLSLLTQQLTVEAVLGFITVFVWLAWFQLVLCLVVEVQAGLRGVGVPARVPLAGATQAVVHKLVVAVLLLFTATTAIMPAFTQIQAKPHQPVVAASPAAQPVVADGVRLMAAQSPEEADGETAKIYKVQPPHGRHHESLWEIAEKCLGDGRRYKEIFELNKGHVQPDGSKLREASLIRPGWVMEMPADARDTLIIPKTELRDYFQHGHAVPDQGSPSRPDKPAENPQQEAPPQQQSPKPQAPPQTPQQESPRPQAPQQQAPQQSPARPDAPGTVHGEPGAPVESPPAETAEAPFPWPEALAGSSLLAAGVLTALGRRRRAQVLAREPGKMIERPEGAEARVEQALRLGADAEGIRVLDLGLRRLSQALAAQGRTLPTVYGLHLGAESMDLWIAPADPNPPEPWRAHDGGQVWRLHTASLTALSATDLADVLAPYPGLISLGVGQNGRVLADLEAAHGVIALDGPPEQRKAALAAVAVELATSTWADHMRLTLVGFGPELAALAPDRIRCVPTLAEALPELESRTAEVRRALAASGADSVLTGRCRGVSGEAWMPHYLVMADQPTKADAARLTALARTAQRLSAGYVVAGHVEGAAWTWTIDEDGTLDAGVLGFQVEAQRIPEAQYRAVASLMRTAGRKEGVRLPELTIEHPPAAEPTAEIRVLGGIAVRAPGPMQDTRRDICTEVLVYLAAHPGGVHPTVLSSAVWPRGVTAGVRDATVAMAADWLGRDGRGRANLYTDERGRLRLGSEVSVDLQQFQYLLWRSAAEPAAEAAYLSHALELVRGRLLAPRPRGRYSWLAADALEYETTARVVDAAHRLAQIRLAERDPHAAVAAARAGLRLAPDDELLWRDLLRATDSTGDPAALRAALNEIRGRADLDQLHPETESLIDELTPQLHARGA